MKTESTVFTADKIKAPPVSACKQVKVKIEKVETVCKQVRQFKAPPGTASKQVRQVKMEDKCCNCSQKKRVFCLFWENHDAYRELGLKVKTKNKEKFPRDSTKTNSSIRWHMYREYVRLHHPELQRGQHIRIPMCVIINFRETWPNEEGGEYAGHKEGFWYPDNGL